MTHGAMKKCISKPLILIMAVILFIMFSACMYLTAILAPHVVIHILPVVIFGIALIADIVILVMFICAWQDLFESEDQQ